MALWNQCEICGAIWQPDAAADGALTEFPGHLWACTDHDACMTRLRIRLDLDQIVTRNRLPLMPARCVPHARMGYTSVEGGTHTTPHRQ